MERRGAIGSFFLGLCAFVAGICFLAGCASAKHHADRSKMLVIGETVPNKVILTGPASTTQVQPAPPHKAWGNYDRAFLAAVQQRWFDLLDQGQTFPTQGLVVLRFTLIPNGDVSDIEVLTNTLNLKAAAVCRKAVLDPAPYPAWPEDMRKECGDKRVITFTFRYQ